MANAAPEKIQVLQYKISGFNVVVTLPDGQQKVLKDGLADLMLGNIVLIDKNGDLISTDQILSRINLKQNALDSAFLGDFIRSKDENDNGADKTKTQQNTLDEKQSELQQTIDKLQDHIKRIESDNPQSEQIIKLANENQHYLQQLQQAKAEVIALKQTVNDKESIKQQLPHQNLAEAFQANQQAPDQDLTNTTTIPVPTSIGTSSPSSSIPRQEAPPLPSPSSSSSSSSSPPIADNQVVVDRDTLEKLEQEKNQAQAQADQAQADKAQAEADKQQAQADKAQAEADKQQAEADKAQAEADKQQAEADKQQAEADKQQAEADKDKTDETLAELGKAHFISNDLIITAKLDPDSDHGNGVASSKTDNITNDKTPTIIGTATESNTENNAQNTVTLLIYRDDDASSSPLPEDPSSTSDIAVSSGTQVVAATIPIPEGSHGEWSYTIPQGSSLIDGKYRYIATTNSTVDSITKSSNPWVGDFTIDTVAPKAKLNSVTTAIIPDEENHPNDWVTATSKPAFTGDTKPGSEVVLTLTPNLGEDITEVVHTYKATASTTGTWAIYLNAADNTDNTDNNDELTGSNYNYSITVTDTAGNASHTDGTLIVDTSDLKTTLELTPESDTGYSQTDWATKDTTPTFTGTASKNGKPVANVHVEITVDGHTYKSDSGLDGKWTIRADNAIANGTQIVLLHAKDDLGKEFTTSHIIVVDDTLPNINASLTYDSDTGDSHTDGITNNPAPSLHGTTKAVPIIIAPGASLQPDSAPDTSQSPTGSSVIPDTTTPGAHIKLTIYYNPTGKGYFDPDNSTLSKVDDDSVKIVKQFNADANGSWNFPVPTHEILTALQADPLYNNDHNNQFVAHPNHAIDGIWQYSVDITDTLGNHAVTEASHLLQWTLDTTPPDNFTIALADGQHTDSTDPDTESDPFASIINTPTYTITTEPGSHILATYQGADGVAGTATATANAQGIASIKFTTPLPLFVPNSGQQPTKVHFVVTDVAGNTASKDVNMKYVPSSTHKLLITASITHDAINDTGYKNDDSITNNTRPEISGTTVAGAKVYLEIHTGGRTIKTKETTADDNGHWAIKPPSDLGEGITTFQAFASSGGLTGSTIGALTVDRTPPTLDNLGLGGPWLGNIYSQPPNDYNNFPVVFEKQIDPNDAHHIIFSTSKDMRQQSMATFTGTASESVSDVLINTLDGTKGWGNMGWKNHAEIHSATHNGRPIVAWAGGFNYYHDSLSDWAKDKLQHANPFAVLKGDVSSLPPSWNHGDLSWVAANIFGLGWRGFNGAWSYDRNWITVTDLAGNSTIYHITVNWNSNAPKIETMTVTNSNMENTYSTDNPAAPLVGYSHNKTGFYINGTSTGAAKVYLVDVSKLSIADLANTTKRDQAVQDALMHKAGSRIIAGTITTDSEGQDTWSVTYLANFRDGEVNDIKVIPVLVNDAGRVQDYLNYIHIGELSQNYGITANLSEKDALIAGGTTTNNHKPTLTGVIEHYDNTTGLSGTISIGGASYPITIQPPKATDPDQSKASWTFTPASELSGSSNTPYKVTITDKYGNSASAENQISIGSLAASLAPADDTGVSDHDGITKNTAPQLIGKINAGDSASITYKLLNGEDTDHPIHNITIQSDGNWLATLENGTKLTDGEYQFTVTSSKDGVNTGATTGYFIIDTSVPVSVTTGVDTSIITAQGVLNPASSNLFNNTPQLTGTVTTGDSVDTYKLNPFPNGGLPVTITVYVPNPNQDGTTITYSYTGQTNSDGSWTIPLNSSTITDKSLPPLPDNPTYTYTVTATDKAGNLSAPAIGTFGLDTTPPAPPQFGVKEGHLHSTSGMDLFTTTFANSHLYGQVEEGDRVTISITGAGLDNLPGSTISNTDLPTVEKPLTFTSWTDPKVPGSSAKITLNANTGKWSLNMDALKDLIVNNRGTGSEQNPNGAYYNVQIKVTDAAGNSSASDFHYQIGKSLPTSSIVIKQEDGQPLNIEHLTFEPSPLFTGHTRPGATVVLNLSGTKDVSSSDKPGGDGNRTITATADDHGDWTIPLSGQSIALKEGFYYYSVSVTDENGLQDTIGAKIMGGHEDKNYLYRLQVNFSKVGTEDSIMFDPKDDSGVSGDHISNITTQHIVGKNTFLTSSINIYISKDQPIDASHPGKLIDAANIIDDKTGSSIILNANNGSWHVNFTDPTTGKSQLTDGIYYIHAVSTNSLGRTDIQDRQITIDTKPPQLDNVALATESDTGLVGDRLTSIKSPTLAGITKPGTVVTVHLDDGKGHDTVQTAKADDDGNWKTTYYNLEDGTYNYWLEATDPAGNTNTRNHLADANPTDNFTIQSTFSGPTDLTINSNLDSGSDTGLHDYVTANTTPTISGTATLIPNTGDNNRSKVFLDITVNGITHTYSGDNLGAKGATTGNYSIKITDPLPDGFYTYKVYTQDAAGNKSQVFDSPSNLHVVGTGGLVTNYSFKVQTTTPYEDTGIMGAATHNVTTSTGIAFGGNILLQNGIHDKGNNYTVTVSATDFNQGTPLTRTTSATVDEKGHWTSGTLNFSSYGTHSYTVSITDNKTGTTTSYSSPFTIQNDKTIILKTNTTEIEQHGSQPTFSGTVPEAGVASLRLYVYDQQGKQISGTFGLNIPVESDHKFNYRYSGSPLANGHYTYKITTVSPEGKESETPALGVLDIWTTPPKLHYTEQDTALHQASNVIFATGAEQIMFAGTLDLKNGKFAATVPTDSVSVKFNDFTLHPTTVDSTTGKWHITVQQYNDALTKAQAEHSEVTAENNTVYTITIQDRFQNTSSDTGDLAPNNDHTGQISMPLFMGESEAHASITVIIIGQRDKNILTSTTTTDDKGQWDLTWTVPLDSDTYHYSVQVTPNDGSNSYNTGQIGSFTISDYIPPLTIVNDIAPATDEHSAETSTLQPVSRNLFDAPLLFDNLIPLSHPVVSNTHPTVTSNNNDSPLPSVAHNSSDNSHTGNASHSLAANSNTASTSSPLSAANTPLTNTASGSEHSDHPASTPAPVANNVAAIPPAIVGTDSNLTADNNGLLSASNAASSSNSALSALLANGTLLSPTGSAPAAELNTISSAPKAASNDTTVSLAALEHSTTDHEHHQAA